MDEVTFGLAILIGVWVFFITARPLRKNKGSQHEQVSPDSFLAGRTTSETETWSFEPEASELSATEQRDHWVMG